MTIMQREPRRARAGTGGRVVAEQPQAVVIIPSALGFDEGGAVIRLRPLR
ncbi:MAG: hypothetical protein HC897_17260, partial [Thermoanaerobaculia bacterium]|nr:hypothetical protein [Thermoanaerobaculia bacterium]